MASNPPGLCYIVGATHRGDHKRQFITASFPHAKLDGFWMGLDADMRIPEPFE